MTAVEWLVEQLAKNGVLHSSDISKAKEMEMQIIAQAFEDGDYNYFYNHQNGREFETGIEYYNNKFKSE
jgi:methanogenic corrinoid protein MtbC1